MLVARGRAKRGNEAVADAHLGKGPEGRGLCAVVLANGPDEPEHPLLDQVLAVAARQKKRARARAHKTGIAPDKRFLRLAAAVGSAAAERLVRAETLPDLSRVGNGSGCGCRYYRWSGPLA